MGMGRYLSFRGRSEIVDSKWSQFTHSQYKSGPDEGKWKVSAKIKDGHDKGNGVLRLGTTSPSNSLPEIRENPEDEWCFVKLWLFYRGKCDASQVRFFCQVDNTVKRERWYKLNNPIGKSKIGEMVKQVAQMASFTSWELFTAHCNRNRCVTQTASSTTVTAKASCGHSRHGDPKSQEPYHAKNTVESSNLQDALLGVGLGDTQTNERKKAPSVSEHKKAANVSIEIDTKTDKTKMVTASTTPKIVPQDDTRTEEINALRIEVDVSNEARHHLESEVEQLENVVETMVLEGTNMNKQFVNQTEELHNLRHQMQRELTQVQQLVQQKAMVVHQLRPMLQQQVSEVDRVRQQLATVQHLYQKKVTECDTLTNKVEEQKNTIRENDIANQFKDQGHKHTIDMMEMYNKNKCNIM